MGVLSTFNESLKLPAVPSIEPDRFVMGEGACVLVLEASEHAEKRGAKPLALLSGFGMTSDAYGIAAPEPNGTWAAMAMQLAVKDAGLDLEDIGYINAHGTSTRVNDKRKRWRLKRLLDTGISL